MDALLRCGRSGAAVRGPKAPIGICPFFAVRLILILAIVLGLMKIKAKINARVTRIRRALEEIAMRTVQRKHRLSAILQKFKWKAKLILGLPWIIRLEIEFWRKDGTES